jgi:hypothetical protein
VINYKIMILSNRIYCCYFIFIFLKFFSVIASEILVTGDLCQEGSVSSKLPLLLQGTQQSEEPDAMPPRPESLEGDPTLAWTDPWLLFSVASKSPHSARTFLRSEWSCTACGEGG